MLRVLIRSHQRIRNRFGCLLKEGENKTISVHLVKMTMLIAVFSSLSVLKFLSASFSIYLDPPFHSNYSIWILLFFTLSVWLYSLNLNFFKFNKSNIALFLLPAIFIIQESIGYVVLSQHISTYYIEFIFWFSLLYFIIDRVILDNNYTFAGLFFLHKYYIISCLFVCIFFIVSKLFFQDSSYLDTVFLFGENHISYVSVSAVLLLLNYPLRFFNNKVSKNIFLSILIATPLVVGNIGGIVAMAFVLLFYIRSFKLLFLSILGVIYTYINIPLDSLYQLYYLFTFGISFEPLLDPNDVGNLTGNLTSTYVRNSTNMLALREFLDNPFFGSGLHKIKQELRYAGHFSHSWIFITLSAYGFFTFVVLLFSMYFSAGYVNNFKKNGYTTLFIFFLLNGMLVSEIYLFFTVLFILYKNIGLVEECQKKKQIPTHLNVIPPKNQTI